MDREEAKLPFSEGNRYEAAVKTMVLCKQAFNELGIPFWLSNGTLLGVARDGDFLLHDKDIDTGVWDDVGIDHALIKRKFVEKGFEFNHEFGCPGDGHEYAFYSPFNIRFDIFFYVRETTNCWMALWVGDQQRRMVFPPMEDYSSVEFCGAGFLIPSNYEAWLIANYGADWKTPVIDWNWMDSPKNFGTILMNETYWKEFYSKPHTSEPSPFAIWAVGSGLCGKRVIDFGCGNGRDTRYLATCNNVVGVDSNAPDEGPMFHRTTIENFLNTNPVADVAYCRFLFHACDAFTEDLILKWVRGNHAVLYMENRSVLDTPDQTHERRLMNGAVFAEKLIEQGFTIFYHQEGHGMAVFKDEDPHIIRMIAEG